jgi:DNA primase large subunit
MIRMKEFDLEKLAKYPFLRESKDYVAALGLTLDEIRRHPLYSASIDLGRQRVHDALNGRIGLDLEGKLSKELSILSYVIARILVNLTNNRTIISRYARAEAENSYQFVRNEKKEIIDEIMKDLDLGVEKNRMYFSDYLRLCTNVTKSDPRWKLVNRVVDKGYVRIRETEIPVLLREGIRTMIMGPIDTKGVPNEFRNIAKGFTSFVRAPEDIRIEQVKDDALPPCIKFMLASLESGTTSHNEMFILGTFFIGLGLNVDDVVRVFSRHPSFNEEKTRYQLAFLSGEKGTTKYSCPSCVKVKSYGLCKAECGVKHPLNYYKMKVVR